MVERLASRSGQAGVVLAEGREGNAGLVIAPTDPFGQVSVTFEKDLVYEIAFTDFWIRPTRVEFI